MSKIETDLNEYLPEETRAEIAEQEFRQTLREQLNKGDVSRILSNISYYAVFEEIDRAVDGGSESLREQIRERAFNFINQGRNYGIFRTGTAWERPSSATKIVEELIQEKRDVIRARALQQIETMPLSAIKDEIKYVLHEQIDNILKGVDDE